VEEVTIREWWRLLVAVKRIKEGMKVKKWYTSKTLWVNLLAMVAIVAQGQFGFVISPEYQLMVLGAINWILRIITKEAIEWK